MISITRCYLLAVFFGFITGAAVGFYVAVEYGRAHEVAAPAEAETSTLSPPTETSTIPQPAGLLLPDPSLGPADASVTLMEFCEFECGFCAMYHWETLPQIVRDYVDTEKIRYVFRNFPLIPGRGDAMNAAIAGECMNLQNRFWEYQAKLFENQENLSEDALVEYAVELGADVSAFRMCLKDPRVSEEVWRDIGDAKAQGFDGTPMFLLNTRQLKGFQPYEAFSQVIEEELNNTNPLMRK
jgi:protein-disulfide isomerase